MPTIPLLARCARPTMVAAALVCAGALAQPAAASTVPAAPPPAAITSSALLSFEDLQAAGVTADSAVLGTRGDQLLGDAGRFDEGCLGEKTMRNMTHAKAYPAPGTARAYFDGVWTNTLDKDVWVNESVAQVRTTAEANQSVGELFDEIDYVTSCEQDPYQGHHYGPPHRVRVGQASATYFLDYNQDGGSSGGGVAVVRDGRRFGFVSLMAGHGKPGVTLKKLATTAAANLR